ncbi:DUF2877 domain-containing protein [Ornithinimicrobium avium]|uniref:DUF2877 domain-containing protein n=1 Tax=Ornithinimicrobium avium TaxID=2283195 RepID=A0A345NP95_9MICO|nr:DUF2877 domain-containing protein [Ornithinimicrobium avium]
MVRRSAPAAASTRAPGWLWGPAVGARVLASSGSAAYLLPVGMPPGMPPGAPAGPPAGSPTADVLALVSPDALRLPGAVLVPGPGDLAALRLAVGATVAVGEGRVQGSGAQLQVRRSWLPRPVPSGSWPAAPEVVTALDGLALRPGRADLGPLAAEALHDPVPGVAALVGLGPGLTPSGDDVLCGMLLVLGAAGHPDRAALADAVRGSLHRTTALSATLLRDALDGYAVPPVRDLLAAAQHGPGPGDGGAGLTVLARAVTRIGHSSGSDLLVGVRTALEHLLATSVHTRPDPVPRED